MGDLLIAFTAFLIPYVASRFWRIFCLVLHRSYSTAHSRDAIHHQRQIVLRNSSSPESGLWSLFNIFWSYRWSSQRPKDKSQQRLRRLFPSTLFAICCISAFTAAGGLSSQISTSRGNVVLLKGGQCGIPASPAPENYTLAFEAARYSSLAGQLGDAQNYVQQCYSANSSGMLDCDRFVVKNLRSKTIQTNASCPFPGPVCRNNNTALVLDSGYLDSNDEFGLNTPSDQRLQWRYVVQCAPLVTEGFTSQVADPNNNTWVRYHYGSSVNSTGELAEDDETFVVPSLDAQYSWIEAGSIGDNADRGVDYRLT